MKGNKTKKALLCIAIILFAFNFIAVQNVSADPTISITDNSGFIGYPGSGTAGDPWRIENKIISAASADGIYIKDTTDYFVIKNCTIYDGGSTYHGIYLNNVTHGRVENCTVYNNTWGIGLSTSSSNNTLTSNTAYNNTAGIVLFSSSSNNTLTSNTAYNNTYGIALSTSPNNTLTSNTAYNNTAGIYLSDSSSNNTITTNTVFNNTYGIVLFSSSSNNTLTSNTAYNNTNYGIYLQYSSNNTLASNTACNNTVGIALYTNCNNNTLTGNTANHNTDTGIHLLDNCNNNTLTNNTAFNNHYNGIILDTNCNNNTLTGNTVIFNDAGIHLYTNCNNNTLTGNTADHNIAGIHLQDNSDDNILTNNTAYNGYGIGYGILLDNNINNTLTNNTVHDNGFGFYLMSSYNNSLAGNTAYNNTRGIQLDFGSGNNTFTDNYVHNYVWDFYSQGKCFGNVVYDLHLYCYPTNISFTYDNGIAVVGVPVGTVPPDPSNQANCSMYVNVTNVHPMSWILLNVSYADADVAGLNESSLRLYRWNGTGWEIADGSGVNGVDTLNNYIYANITQFSILGSFGTPLETALQPKPVGGFVLPAEAPAHAAMLIILAIAVGAVAAAVTRRKLP